MLLRPFLNDGTSCAGYVFGCTSRGTGAVVDPDADLMDRHLEAGSRVPADGVVVLRSHCGHPVCGRGLSSTPFSSIGSERAHNAMLAHGDAEAVAQALLRDMPAAAPGPAEIAAANRRGVAEAPA